VRPARLEALPHVSVVQYPKVERVGWDPDGGMDPQGAQESMGVGDPDRNFIQTVQRGKEKREGTKIFYSCVVRAALTFCLNSASASSALSLFIHLIGRSTGRQKMRSD